MLHALFPKNVQCLMILNDFLWILESTKSIRKYHWRYYLLDRDLKENEANQDGILFFVWIFYLDIFLIVSNFQNNFCQFILPGYTMSLCVFFLVGILSRTRYQQNQLNNLVQAIIEQKQYSSKAGNQKTKMMLYLTINLVFGIAI